MPCKDITEVLRFTLDDADCLRSYSLFKRTCGAIIGQEALLHGLLFERNPEQILALTGEDIRTFFASIPDEDEFIYFKHLVALQESLKVLLGETHHALGEGCTPLDIFYEAGETHYEGLVHVTKLAPKIRACGNCGSCGKNTKLSRASAENEAARVTTRLPIVL